jgi:hypothetical protein
MDKMAAAALRYAQFGWPVIPVHTQTGDLAKPCSCRRITRRAEGAESGENPIP